MFANANDPNAFALGIGKAAKAQLLLMFFAGEVYFFLCRFLFSFMSNYFFGKKFGAKNIGGESRNLD